MLTVSVIVATYHRPDSLARCLDGLARQARPPEETIVVVHRSDAESRALVKGREGQAPAVRVLTAPGDGSVSAYNAGLAAARGDVVAYLDDDAVPREEWVSRLVSHFGDDPSTLGVGGRDLIHEAEGRVIEPPPGAETLPVGLIQPFGRMIANHHLAAGPVREVDVLKGVNMSFRRVAVRGHGFDPRLRGAGAQVHAELSICLPVRAAGGRLVYDPELVVDHFPAPRPAGDHRVAFDAARVADAAHNEALAILEYLSARRRVAFALWSLLLGSTESPGAVALMRDVARGRPHALRRALSAQRGRFAGWRTHRRRPRPLLGHEPAKGPSPPPTFPDSHMASHIA